MKGYEVERDGLQAKIVVAETWDVGPDRILYFYVDKEQVAAFDQWLSVTLIPNYDQ